MIFIEYQYTCKNVPTPTDNQISNVLYTNGIIIYLCISLCSNQSAEIMLTREREESTLNEDDRKVIKQYAGRF